MTIRATRRVSDDDHPPSQHAETDDSLLTMLLAGVFNFKGDALKNYFGIRKAKAALRQRFFPLKGIDGDDHAGYCSYNDQNSATVACLLQFNF